MKIRKEYMVKYVDDVPYLLPYGQGIAQKFYGLRLDSDEVFLWELIQEHYDEIGCVHEMAEHKNIPPENQDAVEQKVANFFEILEQYNERLATIAAEHREIIRQAKHEAKELLIAQTSLNNHFSKMAAQGKDLVYKNAYCEIRKGCIYVKPTTRGRKKERGIS